MPAQFRGHVRKLPLRIALLAFERRDFRGEQGDLDRRAPGLAVDAHDAAARRRDDDPVGLAGERVGVELAQVAAHVGEAWVAQEIFKFGGVAWGADGGFVVAFEGVAEFQADGEQVFFGGAALQCDAGTQGGGGGDGKEGGEEDDAEQGEAAPCAAGAAR